MRVNRKTLVYYASILLKSPLYIAVKKTNNKSLCDFLLKPKNVTFNITNCCNSRCITCNTWRRKSINELSTEEAKYVLHQVRKIGVTGVTFAGGEPLLRKDLPEIIKTASQLNFKRISLVSNGFLLDSQLAKVLIDNGLTDFNLSMDGTGKTHDKIRGIKGASEKVMTSIALLTKLRDSGHNCQISILCTFMDLNLREIINIVSISIKLKIKLFFNLLDNSPYFFSGVDFSDLLIKNTQQLDLIIESLHKIKKKQYWLLPQLHTSLEFAKQHYRQQTSTSNRNKKTCYLGFISVYIGPHGEVYSGCWTLPPVGNLTEKNLKDILSSEDYQNRLRAMLLGRCPGCTCNYDLNLLQNPKILLREFLQERKK